MRLIEALDHEILVWREHLVSTAHRLPEAETCQESSRLQTDEKIKQFFLECPGRLTDLVQFVENAADLGTQLVETVLNELVCLIKAGNARNSLELNGEFT